MGVLLLPSPWLGTEHLATSEGSPVWTDIANKQNPLQEVLQCRSFPLLVQGLCINTETLNLHCEVGDAVMLLMIQP